MSSFDLDNSFVDELRHFAKFADIFKDDEPGNISTELFCIIYTNWLFIRVCSLPNVAIALRMYLVLMVINCSAERSFPKLKLIENRLRTSMTQGRLVNLASMSIEPDILRTLSATLLLQNRERCLVFDFRLLSLCWIFELHVHAWFL